MPNAERATPENIQGLEPNEVFVFGSNLAGRHGKGAALIAKKKFGAIYGDGFGPTGRCYAIPTKGPDLKSLSLDYIAKCVAYFNHYASAKPEITFLVTAIGTGLAGYKTADIAPMFRDAPDNVVLPASFLSALN